MKQIVCGLVLVFLLAVGGANSIQENDYAVKADFIVKFTKFIKWPNVSDVSYLTDSFSIFIYGDDGLSKVIST